MTTVKLITEDFWLDNLCDRDGESLRALLARTEKDNQDRIKSEVFAHARDVLQMYCVPGRPRPLFPERWQGRWGLLHHARSRFRWLAAPKVVHEEIERCRCLANDLQWKADRHARDWREQRELEHEARFWRFRGDETIREIQGEHYESPACLI